MHFALMAACISAWMGMHQPGHAQSTPLLLRDLVPRVSIEYDRQNSTPGMHLSTCSAAWSGGTSEFQRLVPASLGPPPPDTQTLLAAVLAAGVISPESWQVIDNALVELHQGIEAIAQELDAFEAEYPPQYFLNYPAIKPVGVRRRRDSLRDALVEMGNRFIVTLRASGREDQTIDAAINRMNAFMHDQLMHGGPGTKLLRMADLKDLASNSARPLSPNAQQIIRQWQDQTIPLLKRWQTQRREGLDRWQLRLAQRQLPEPPHRSEDWQPADRAAALELYRECMSASHQSACDLIRVTLAAVDSLLEQSSHTSMRHARMQFSQQTFGLNHTTAVRRLAYELGRREPPDDAAAQMIQAWDRSDWQLVREAVSVALRDADPSWPYHHRIEPQRPEMARRFESILQQRDAQASAILSQIEHWEVASQPQEGVPTDSQRSARHQPFVGLVPDQPQPEPGGSDFAILAAPAPIRAEWLSNVNAALGSLAQFANVNALAASIQHIRMEVQRQLADRPGDAWNFTCDGYVYDAARAADLRRERETSRVLIANAERDLLNMLERFAPLSKHADRLRLYCLARRALEHRMIEALRWHLAPRDPAAMMEPLSALIALNLPIEIEETILREVEHDADRYVMARRRWLDAVIEPVLDYLEAQHASVWRRDQHTMETIAAAIARVHDVHAGHIHALGDMALALAERIEDALDQEQGQRFRRAVMIQVCPSVWSIEPAALHELRHRAGRSRDNQDRAALAAVLSAAEADDLRVAGELTRILGAFDAAAAWRSPTDLAIRTLVTRRVEQAERHLARAIAGATQPSALPVN